MCFFIVYFCLLIITTKAIIKANAMIVTDTRPANSNFIIICKISISTIRLTSLLEANHICLFSFPIVDNIQHLHIYFKPTKKFSRKYFNTFLTRFLFHFYTIFTQMNLIIIYIICLIFYLIQFLLFL